MFSATRPKSTTRARNASIRKRTCRRLPSLGHTHFAITVIGLASKLKINSEKLKIENPISSHLKLTTASEPGGSTGTWQLEKRKKEHLSTCIHSYMATCMYIKIQLPIHLQAHVQDNSHNHLHRHLHTQLNKRNPSLGTPTRQAPRPNMASARRLNQVVACANPLVKTYVMSAARCYVSKGS